MNRYWMLVKTRDFFFCLSSIQDLVSSIQDLLGIEHELTFPDKIDNPKIFF